MAKTTVNDINNSFIKVQHSNMSYYLIMITQVKYRQKYYLSYCTVNTKYKVHHFFMSTVIFRSHNYVSKIICTSFIISNGVNLK